MKQTYAFFFALLAVATQAQVTHELQVEDDEFNPPSLTINAGDHVHIFWDNSVVNDHNVTEVEQATWNVNGTAPLAGGYQLGVGTPSPGTDFTITPLNSVWYVCTFHAGMGMKGVINVMGGNGIEEATAQDQYLLAPNPASDVVSIMTPSSDPFTVRFTDAAGRTVLQRALNTTRTVDVSTLNAGLYVVEFRDARGTLLARQRSLIAH